MIETPKKENNKAVIYCRVSTKEQADDGNSLVSQERLCREYALREGYDVSEVFIEKGESAKTADRKEWQRLLVFCENKKNDINTIIAYKIDRISRNIADYSYFKVRLKKHNVTIRSVTEFFEDTPAGRFMENIIANVGQFDNDVRAERCAGGMREAVLEGRYVWMAPIGYSNVRVNDKATIAKNDTAPLMKETFELIAQRAFSTEAIRLLMAKKGLVTRNGLPVTNGHFHRLIRNPLYMGTIKKMGVTTKGIFEPIVSEELFTVVQNVLKGRKNPTKNYVKERPDFPLRRFVLHPSGKKLSGYWAQGNRLKYPYYSFGLPGTSYAKEKFENKFMEFLGKYRFDMTHLSTMKHFLEVMFNKETKGQQVHREALQSRITEINEQIDKLVALQLDGGISVKLLAERTQRFEKELEQLSGLLVEKSPKIYDIRGLLKFAAQALQQPQELWKAANFERRKYFQVFGFPQGISFDGEKFRTTEVCRLFNVKELIDKELLTIVDYEPGNNNSVNTTALSSEQKVYHSKAFWEQIVADLEILKEVMEDDTTKTEVG